MTIATQRSIEDYKAQQNVERVKEHMVDEELEKLLERTKNMDVDAFIDDVLNNQEDPDTRIEPRSDKESLEAKKDANMVTIHDEELEEGSVGDEFDIRMREKGKGIEETRDTPTPIRSHRTHISPLYTNKEKLQELTVITQDTPLSMDKERIYELAVIDPTPSSSSPKPKAGRKKFHQLAKHVHSTIEEFLPSMTQANVAAMIVEAIKKEAEIFGHRLLYKLIMTLLTVFLRRTDIIRPRDHDDHHDDAHPEGENSAKRQKMFEQGTYSVSESSSKQAMEQEPNPSCSCTQEQLDEFDAWIGGIRIDHVGSHSR
nr:hypothetical protein [Tanacetum cinerariifolium]